MIAHDLLPSQTAALDRKYVKGFATDVGGRTSHTAIVARAMGIPAVVGLGNITSEVSGGDIVIIDGTRGVVIVNPDAEQLADYRETGRKFAEWRTRAAVAVAASRPTRWTGMKSACMANIEFPEDIEDADCARAPGHRPVSHRVSLSGQRTRADRRGALRRLRRSPAPAEGQAAGHPHAGSGRRQIHARPSRRTPSAIRFSATARSGCACTTSRCSSGSFGRSCGPACWAMCGSCSP